MQATYHAAYLLFQEGIRMQVLFASLRPRGMFDRGQLGGPRVTARTRYTTESLQSHRIKSFDDFERHTPHRKGWLTLIGLSVHPDDEDRGAQVLERAGMVVEKPPANRRW